MRKNKPADICWTLQSHLYPFHSAVFRHYCRRSAAPLWRKPSRVHGCQPGQNNNRLEICCEKLQKKILPSRFIKRNNLKWSDSELKAPRFIKQMLRWHEFIHRSSLFHPSITWWGFTGVLDLRGTGRKNKKRNLIDLHSCYGKKPEAREELLTRSLEQSEI